MLGGVAVNPFLYSLLSTDCAKCGCGWLTDSWVCTPVKCMLYLCCPSCDNFDDSNSLSDDDQEASNTTIFKQAAAGPSRRHIKGSKIAKDFKVSEYWWIGGGDPFMIFFEKSHNAEKNGRETLWDFQHPFCRKTPKKIEGGPFGYTFFSKIMSHNAEKCPTMVQLPGPTGTFWRHLWRH